MTREEIMRLEGRELDIQVAFRVFEIPYEICIEGDSDSGLDAFVHIGAGLKGPLPHYSTDIDAAWQVVEEMNRRGFVARVEVASAKAERYDPVTGATKLVADGVAWVYVGFGRNEQEVHMHLRRFIDVPVPTAICRAALLARLEADGDA